jgi:hypothetical protein
MIFCIGGLKKPIPIIDIYCVSCIIQPSLKIDFIFYVGRHKQPTPKIPIFVSVA